MSMLCDHLVTAVILSQLLNNIRMGKKKTTTKKQILDT